MQPRKSSEDDEVLVLATVEPSDEADSDAAAAAAATAPANANRDVGDDRADGENWVDNLIEQTAEEVPAERPLIIPDDDARSGRRH